MRYIWKWGCIESRGSGDMKLNHGQEGWLGLTLLALGLKNPSPPTCLTLILRRFLLLGASESQRRRRIGAIWVSGVFESWFGTQVPANLLAIS